MPELKRDILNFGYRINFKYEGMLAHSFDRFYVVTKFIFPYLSNLKNFCKKIVPFIDFYKKQIDYYNKTAHRCLTKEISLVLPSLSKDIKEKRSIIVSLVTNFISLAYEGISSYLYNKRQKALKKSICGYGK